MWADKPQINCVTVKGGEEGLGFDLWSPSGPGSPSGFSD